MGNCLKTSAHEDSITNSELSETQQNVCLNNSHTEIPDREAFSMYHVVPYLNQQSSCLTEQEEIEIVKRIGIIQQLPTSSYDDNCKEKHKECVICMDEFFKGDTIRYLPCTHMYHKQCIDSWLIRNFTCPSCMEPLDSAKFSKYDVISHNCETTKKVN